MTAVKDITETLLVYLQTMQESLMHSFYYFNPTLKTKNDDRNYKNTTQN